MFRHNLLRSVSNNTFSKADSSSWQKKKFNIYFFHGISPFENVFLQAPKVYLVATRNPHRGIGDMPEVKTRHRTSSHNSYTLPLRHL